jgi:triacylglycerol lipase
MVLVIMHGFGAFMHLLASVSVKPMAAALSRKGYDVHAPMVQPYNTVPERAEAWMEHLVTLAKGKDAEIHLIAFSSGGLDARYAISHLGANELVTSLTTISTPHFGSSLAAYILERPPSIRNGITKLADWMGDRIEGDGTSEARVAIEQLTPDYMKGEFNPSTPDHPEVAYYSWAGQAGLGTQVPILPVLKPTNRIIHKHEGINDGIVSVKSAQWTGFMGTIDADHARQIGVRVLNGSFDAVGFVSFVADRLRSGTRV